MSFRGSTATKAVVTVLLILALIGFLIVSQPGNGGIVSTDNKSTFLSKFWFAKKNRTIEFQKKYPKATCPIGKELVEEDYPVISDCVDGYPLLATQSIDASQMEYQRVMIHKPYLSRNDSLMIEVGGYKGVDADRINKQGMHPHYITLEPVPAFYKLLVDKFHNNPRFKVLNFGLGRKDDVLTIPIQTDATSLFRQNNIAPGTKTTDIKIRKSTEFFDEVGVKKKSVDLLHINCEGCEFELLEDLINTDYVKYFNHIQFQFHMNLQHIKNEGCRYCQIMQLLGRTHRPMFQYRHTWQAWEKIA